MSIASRLTSRWNRAVDIDFHVLATLMSRGWSIIAGALTVLLVPLFLTPTEQGYYFTIASLAGLQILFELGLGQVILQMVGHEMAHLRLDEHGCLQGDQLRRDRLASLVQLLHRWYRVAAGLFAVLAGTAGAIFLYKKGALPPSEWLGAWILITLCTAVNLTNTPSLAFMEGCGRIGEVARLRLRQSIIGYIGLWMGLTLNLGLWAASFVPLTACIATGFWLRRMDTLGTALQRCEVPHAHALDWRRDLFPFQWRIALSAMSGYFIFYLTTPLVFASLGAREAGRFGLATAIFNALATVGTSWVYARTPTMAMHVSRRERSQLDQVFRGVLVRSLAFTTMGAASLVLTVLALRWLGVAAMQRIADPSVLACLASACIANSVIFSAAAYMRAHREEPMLPISVVSAMLTTSAAWLSSRHGLLAMAIAYAAVTVLVTLPWTLAILRRYMRRIA